ncbi:MAG: hypothetical protein K2I93_02265, partial [Oscillospiraceae bacterium]|nr:hypothetical protein [Oscillospiraceae bacterium]
MAAKSNLTDFECLALIKYASDALTSKNTESAAASIVENLRVSFGVSCISIREIISRPYSLRYTYESIKDPTKVKRINETVTFDADIWQKALDKFSEGSFIYKADADQSAPQFIGPVPNMPM